MKRNNEHSFIKAETGRAMGPDTARPNTSEIAALAYQLWLARGCPEGSADTDWLLAEQQLKNDDAIGASMAA